MSEREPGYPVTKDSPPVGSRVLGRWRNGPWSTWKRNDPKSVNPWSVWDEYTEDWHDTDMRPDRWAPLPGESALERVLANLPGGRIYWTCLQAEVYLIGKNITARATTPDAACTAALDALEGE